MLFFLARALARSQAALIGFACLDALFFFEMHSIQVLEPTLKDLSGSSWLHFRQCLKLWSRISGLSSLSNHSLFRE